MRNMVTFLSLENGKSPNETNPIAKAKMRCIQENYRWRLRLISSQTTLDPKTSKKIFELALDQREESEDDDFGVLDLTASGKNAPRPQKPIDEDEDDEGMASSDGGDVDLEAELELVGI